MEGQKGDFQSGSEFISFDPPSPPKASSSRLPPPPTTPSGISSLPAKPQSQPQNRSGSSTNQTQSSSSRKGKRKASDPDPPSTGKKKKRDLDSNNSNNNNNNSKGKKKNGNGKDKDKENGKGKGTAGGGGGGGGKEVTGPKNLKQERLAAERNAPWADLVDWEGCRDPAEMLNEEIIAFYKYVSPTRAEFEVRLYIIELITRSILKLWPDAEVTPFGSWQTQLYLPQGDIDLVVSNKNFSEANKARLLSEMAKAVRMARITDVVAIISKARVPIIKFVTLEGKLNVDISLNQTNGISAGKIINQYLDALPGARQLILVVKSFLSQRSMNEVYTGGLGSYAVICLVISFLQIHPKLRRSEMDPEENLGTLLIEFFELYGRNFNYQDVGLSIRKGGFYYLKSSRGWQRANQSFLLSIEDPQDRDNDISGGSFGIRQVKNTLGGAYELLLMRLFERAEEMSGRNSGRKNRDYDPDKMSVLTGVMGITKETLKQRRDIEKLHAEGRLQRALGIPDGADPKDHVINYRPPPAHLQDDSDIDSPQERNGQLNLRSSEEPYSRRSRRGGDGSAPGVGAIIVDDDEVPSDSDEDFDSDFDDYDDFESRFESAAKRAAAIPTPTPSKAKTEAIAKLPSPTKKSTSQSIAKVKPGAKVEVEESGSEDGEIVEVFPSDRQEAQARTQMTDRFASVSEDELDAIGNNEEGEEESRYALSNSKNKSKTKAKTKTKIDELYTISDSDLDSVPNSDSDSSGIIAVSKGNGKENRKVEGKGKMVKGKDRRAFWAAKAGAGVGHEEDFEDGTEFIGLD